MLGSEPDISTLYSTKAGARRLFESAGMTTPPYKVDIFSEEQLFKSLALLVVNNPLISRWIFKLPEQVQGRGFGEYICCMIIASDFRIYLQRIVM